MPLGEEAVGLGRSATSATRGRCSSGRAQVRRALRHRARRGDDAPGFLAPDQALRARGGAAQAALAAHAAPRLRHAPHQPRRRPARGADAARPRRHLDHADLHPRGARAPEGAAPRSTTRAASAEVPGDGRHTCHHVPQGAPRRLHGARATPTSSTAAPRCRRASSACRSTTW